MWKPKFVWISIWKMRRVMVKKPHDFFLIGNKIAINNKELGLVHANCIAPAALYALSTILATVLPKRKESIPTDKPKPTYFHVKSSQ
jgi:hypothetical protein